MIQKSTRRIAALFLVSDLVATLAALAAAYCAPLRAEIVPVTKGVPDAVVLLPALPLHRRPLAARLLLLRPLPGAAQPLARRGGARRPRGDGPRDAAPDRDSRPSTAGFSYSRLVLAPLLRRSTSSSSSRAAPRSAATSRRRGATAYGVRRVLVVGAGRLGPRRRRQARRAPRGRAARGRLRRRRPAEARRRRTAACRSLGTTARRRADRRASAASTRSSWRCRSRRTARCSRS